MSMKAVDKTVIRIRAEDARAAALWTLPVVKSKHVVGLECKPEPVVEEAIEEVVDGRLTLSELEKIREDAYQEGLLEGHKEGVEQGLEEGRAKGQAEGLAAARQDIEAQLVLLNALKDQLDQPLKQVNSQVEALIVALIAEFGQAVVGAQVELDGALVVTAVEDAIAQLPQTGSDIKVLLHPEDVPALEPLLVLNEHWSLVEDASLSRGSCKVLSGYGLIDNTLERRFDAASERLHQALIQLPDEAGGDASMPSESHE
ncbi:flagellar assembly protein FliH [Amphritea japonica]|uniref:Flagellar assembly protein FliH n=1 Tax=Amphritea japonica ATCC BAA-1530 TaxID=1278309 RepID=A0A7R6SS32_9GAMM|nr:flagellar assembly protein FliH [Amphritea japonica]BBB25172.1 flagellar assembly protein FliH [Amphritea japonica ATCC BAA-1530]